MDPLEAVPFDQDGDPTTFSDGELSAIAGVWQRVAEDYAPFSVDVTTEEPAAFGPNTGRVLITDSVAQVEQGTVLVDQAGHTMEEIVGAIKRVSDIVGEISSASVEQSSGVTQVGQAVSRKSKYSWARALTS